MNSQTIDYKRCYLPRWNKHGLQRYLAACGVVTESSTVQHRLLDVGRNARRLIKKAISYK